MQTDNPPYVPLRHGGWPARRAPRRAIAGGVGLLALVIAVALPHHPSASQRAADLRTFLATLNSDVESCAGGVRESLYVLRAIETGASHDTATALRVATYGAANCSPANNELLDNLTAEQPPESLARYDLQRAVTALINWAAPDAMRVQSDVAAILRDRGSSAEPAALAALRTDLRALDAQRTVFNATLGPAIRTLSPGTKQPPLPR